MEHSALAAIAGILMITRYSKGDAGQTFVYNCSNYTVHKPSISKPNWWDSLDVCKQNGSALVSIETPEEMNFLKEELNTENKHKHEYFIGLRNHSGRWRWISNDNIVITPKKYPWTAGQPSGNGNCVKIYFETADVLRCDDVPCGTRGDKIGFICEKHVCHVEKATTTRITTTMLPATSASQSTKPTQQKSTGATPSGKANSDIPASKPEKGNSLVIVVASTALAVIILVILILLWFLFVRRPRSKASNSKTQPDDGSQHQQSSTQMTMHAILTPLEERLDTYETVNDDKQEHAYDNIEKGNRKRRSEGHGESSVHTQETTMQTHLVPSDQSVAVEAVEELYTTEENSGVNETRGGHVYAIVHVHPDQGTAAFLKDKERVQRQSRDLTCPSQKSSKGESHVESEIVSPVKTEKPVTKSDAGIAGQKGEDECKDYLYAVVDKANKKRKVPQMPAPYRSLVYADLSHSPEKSAGRTNRASFPTFYAAIDYAKTDAMKSKLPQENEDQTVEPMDGSDNI